VPDENNTAVQAGATQELTPEQLTAKLWGEVSAERSNPPATTPDEPPAETPPAETPPAEEPPEELPDELKKALTTVDDLKSLVTRLTHQVQSSDGRVNALLQREQQQAKAATQVVSRAPNEQAVRAAAKTPEAWAKIKNEFPEWGEAIESLVTANIPAEQQPVDLSPLQKEIQDKINGVLGQFQWAIEEAKLFGAYKNYKTIVNSPEFKTWWSTQPGDIQGLTASAKAEDAIKSLDLFGAAQQKAKDAARNVSQDRGAKLAAAAVPARKPSAPPPADDRELTAAQIWEAEAAARAQKRASRY